MDVQMKHRLTGVRSDVEDGTVSILNAALTGDVGSREMAAAN